MADTFTEAWAMAKHMNSLNRRHFENIGEVETINCAMFYYQDAMYRIDDGSLVPQDNYMAQEMVRIGRLNG